MRALFSAVAFAAITALGLVSGAVPSNAGSIVTPSGLATTEGNTAGNFLGNGSVGQQKLYDISSADFGATQQITGIAFRTDTNLCAGNPCGAYGPITLHNVTIELATTSIAPTTNDTTFADYLTTNLHTALTGNVTVSSAGNALATGPQVFDIVFNFTTPYTYNSASGNLVLDIMINSSDAIPSDVDAQSGFSDMSEYFGCVTCANTTTGNGNSNVDVIEFLTASGTQSVPEPASLALLGTALAGFGLIRRRKRV